jgi:hypothetical protein
LQSSLYGGDHLRVITQLVTQSILGILHAALSQLLGFYPHLTGPLRINAKDGSTEIRQPGEGVDCYTK